MTEMPFAAGLTGRTRVVGIFGDPVAHSLSPLMQNEAIRRAGIDAVYVPFHVTPERLPEAVSAIRALELTGVNVTIPHKEVVLPLLDEVTADASRIGAVNTIVNSNGRLVGYNTDGAGFVQSLRDDLGFDPVGGRVVLLGAGGACRAALFALADAGAGEIVLVNRTMERAETLQQQFQPLFEGTRIAASSVQELSDRLCGADLLVNTTSLGLKGEAVAGLDLKKVTADLKVYDMVYRPEETPLVRAARAAGLQAADGLGMLAAQGELAFACWFGTAPPSGVMKRRLLAEVAEIRRGLS
ncbi:MAG: shikimate dehydrogenase [Geothermobacteraceae bacterium]